MLLEFKRIRAALLLLLLNQSGTCPAESARLPVGNECVVSSQDSQSFNPRISVSDVVWRSGKKVVLDLCFKHESAKISGIAELTLMPETLTNTDNTHECGIPGLGFPWADRTEYFWAPFDPTSGKPLEPNSTFEFTKTGPVELKVDPTTLFWAPDFQSVWPQLPLFNVVPPGKYILTLHMHILVRDWWSYSSNDVHIEIVNTNYESGQ